MEALLVIGSPQKGRELILPLSLGGVRVRKVLAAGDQLVAELRLAPVEALLMAESLPDGAAEQWLKQVALLPKAPLMLLLLYGIEPVAVVQERCRTVYGPWLEVLPAGALPPQQLAGQAAQRLERMRQERLAQAEQAVEPSSLEGEGAEAQLQPGGGPQQSDPLAEASTQRGAPNGPVVVGPSPQATPSADQGIPTSHPRVTASRVALVRRPGALSLALLGATGGVGTSTLTANLAALVSSVGGRVLVVDAGFSTGLSQAYLLGAQSDEAVRGLHHLRWGYLSGRPGTPAEVAPWLDYGKEIALLQLPPILDAIWNLPAEQILWGTRAMETAVDLILFDLGTGIGSPRTLALIQAASQTLLLASGSGAGLQGASRLLRALEERPERDRLAILLRAEEGGVGRAGKALGLPIYAQLPTDPQLVAAGSQGRAPPPLVLEAPNSPYALAVRSLAAKIGLIADQDHPQPPATKERRGLFNLSLGRR